MRAVEVLDNLKGFNAWEYSSYHMSKEEADVCIEALEEKIEAERLREMQNETG